MGKCLDALAWWLLLWLPQDKDIDFYFFVMQFNRLNSPLSEYFWDSLSRPTDYSLK